MSAQPPKTPPRPRARKGTPDSNQGDTFEDALEDAPDITPKPRVQSLEATRSLTENKTLNEGRKVAGTASSTTEVAADKDKNTTVEHLDGNADKKAAPQRLSFSGMDEVNLGEADQQSTRGISPTRASVQSVQSVSSVKNSTVSLSRTSSQGSQPTTSPLASASSPDKSIAASITSNAANMGRRFNSPFSWLSRAATGGERKIIVPPPLMSSANGYDHRRSDPAFGKHDNQETSPNGRHSQTSLKDRFRAVRMREEAGIISVGEELIIGSPTMTSPEEKPESPGAVRRGSVTSSVSGHYNSSLLPGTAAGIAEGPRGAAPVDWDLWQAVVTEGPGAVTRTSDEELRQAVADGIPQVIRGVIWQVFAGSKNDDLETFYHELVARGTEKERLGNGHNPEKNENGKERDSLASSISSVQSEKLSPLGLVDSPAPSADGFTNPLTPKPKSAREEGAHIQSLEKTIRRDLGARTSYSKYLMAAGLQDGLFGICKAYALYDEEVGYAQGMNFIAMPLLFNMPEAEAFCLFARLMSKYGLREMFTQDMPGLHLHLYQFERLLEDFEPALYCHLHRRGVTPDLYATQWFLTLFAYRFPLQLVQRIYDLILSDGLESSILRFGIVLMQKNKDALLGMRDMSQISQFLKEKLFDVYIDKAPSAGSILESGFFGSTAGIDKEVYKADQLVQDACTITISQDMLKLYTAEWDDKCRIEKERETEVETLRAQNSILSSKVRRLEERAEKSDTEHVQVASELVRTKVDNEVLLDENESLKGQVDELKQVVSRQTEEVEARLKGEMDEVMRRNIEVHNANRALEDEKQEMERALVETKMLHAQVNSEHETLKDRWQNVIKLMK